MRRKIAIKMRKPMNLPRIVHRINRTIPIAKKVSTLIFTSLPYLTLIGFYLKCNKLAKTSEKWYSRKTLNLENICVV